MEPQEEPPNLNRRYYKLGKTISEVLKDQFAKSREPVPGNPLRTFLLRNARRPRIDELLTALETGRHDIANRLIGQISADGWRGFLKGVKSADARAMFRYLAKAEGREKRVITQADPAPIILEIGSEIISGRGKSEAIAVHFAKRLAAPEQRTEDGSTAATNQHRCPLQPFRERIHDPMGKIDTWETKKAITVQSDHKAPGPDSLTAELFKHLPSMTPVLTKLYTEMPQRGRIPTSLTRLYIAPPLKMGKDPHKCN